MGKLRMLSRIISFVRWRTSLRRGEGGDGMGKLSTNSINIKVTGVQNDWPVDVVVIEVFERHIFDVSVSNIWTSPTFKTSSVLNGIRMNMVYWNK